MTSWLLWTWTRFRAVLASGMLLVGSTALSLLAGEAALRMLHSGDIRDHRLFTTYHPVLGWTKIPNKTGIHSTPEYRVTEAMNSEGIRGPEYSRVKRQGERRILVLGDSYAEGYTVEFEELFSEVLKRRLNARVGAKDYYEVINTGTGGYSTDQEFLLFQSLGKAYHPDTTILMFVGNDVFYNNSPSYPRGYKPLFRLENGALRLTNVPVPWPPPGGDPSSPTPPPSAGGLKAWLGEHSRFYTLVAEQARQNRMLHKLAVNLRLATPESGHGLGQVPEEFGVWKQVYDPPIREAWAITEALLRLLRDEVTAAGSQLIIYYVPPSIRVYPEEWAMTREHYGLSEEGWSAMRVEKELGAICARLGIRFINPADRFVTEATRLTVQGDRLYFPLDGHWNRHGHRLAGEVLADYLSTN